MGGIGCAVCLFVGLVILYRSYLFAKAEKGRRFFAGLDAARPSAPYEMMMDRPVP
jgi:hypothetical protein